MSASRPPRKSPFRRPESPASPASPSPVRTSPLSPLRSSTSTPVLPATEETPKPTSPLRNSTNFSNPVEVSEDSPLQAQAPIKPISPLFSKTPSSPGDSSPTKPTSPLRNSITAEPPTINIFEDSFSSAKPQPFRSPPQLDAPFASPQPTAMSTPGSNRWTPRGLRPTNTGLSSADPTPTKVGAGSRSTSFLASQSQFETSASRGSTPSNVPASPAASKRPAYGARAMSESNALSKLQPAQVRELRECFQILDRDSDGVVDADDVRDMLNQLGLPSSDRDVEQFFPSGGAGGQKSTMAVFLTQISTLLATLSPSAELLNAFSAFDDDDSGQVDLAELRDALLHTIPDQGEQALTPSEVDRVLGGFSGRRAFGKTIMGGKRGEVFKYQEFVNSIAGGKSNGVQIAEE